MSEIKVLLIGSDPEFMLRSKVTKELVSSIGIIPGTKEEPSKPDDLNGYTIQIDNVLGEISVPPAADKEGLWNNIQIGLDYVRNNFLSDDLEIAHLSSGYYTEEQLDNDIARQFGCMPSLNAWSKINNDVPVSDNLLFRGCGCHIHLSYENPSEEMNFEIARAFDLFCTLPSILLDDDRDRRHFYGKAGELRHCSYGVELRTIGGFLLANKDHYDYILDNMFKAIEWLNQGNRVSDHLGMDIQFTVNTYSANVAEAIMMEYNIPLFNKIEA